METSRSTLVNNGFQLPPSDPFIFRATPTKLAIFCSNIYSGIIYLMNRTFRDCI